MSNLLTRRGGYWYYVRRVPQAVAGLDARRIIFQSTKIRVADDPRGIRAAAAAKAIDGETEAYWRGLADGRSAEATARYGEARRRARVLGFDYAPAGELAGRPLDDILARVERLLSERGLAGDAATVSALVGLEDRPTHLLSTLLEDYRRVVAPSLTDLSPDQLRKWANPKKRAIANLVGRIGDKALDAISRGDAIDFRDWWSARVVAGAAGIGTANKDIGAISAMIAEVERHHRLGLTNPFRDLRIRGEHGGQRTAFLPGFVQSRLLADGALAGLNAEARRVLYLVADTGLRLSEAVNLTAETIVLDADVPHVIVRPDGRRMKTPHSGRAIPLVGVALAAARAQPDGFPRYRDKGGSLSATVNKFLDENGLRPTANHTLYSLRHTFEDRLTAVDPPDKIIATLMGHKHQRPRYGLGPDLAQLQRWMLRIAFEAPLQT